MELTRVDASLYNPDLAPIPLEKRSWGTYNYASLWVAMSVCIPTYMLASGLIAGGMDWIQAVFTILLGNLIVLIPMAFRFQFLYVHRSGFAEPTFPRFCGL
jgi:NCS1 family nucleobase:cation symporter-1